jgi:hypothetical protein
MYGVDTDDASPRNGVMNNVNDADNAANLADQMNNDSSDISSEEMVDDNGEPQSDVAAMPSVQNDDGPIVFEGPQDDEQMPSTKPDMPTVPRQDFTVLDQGTYNPNEKPIAPSPDLASSIPTFQPIQTGNTIESPKEEFTLLSRDQVQPSKPYPAQQQSDDGYHYDKPSIKFMEGASQVEVVVGGVEIEKQNMIELPTIIENVQADTKPYPPPMDYLPPQQQRSYIAPQQQMNYFAPQQQRSYLAPQQQMDYLPPRQQMDYLPPNQYHKF